MKKIVYTLLLGVLLVLTPAHRASAFGWSINHLSAIADGVVSHLLSESLQSYLKQWFSTKGKGYSGVLTDSLEVAHHVGGSDFSMEQISGQHLFYLDSTSVYRESISSVPFDGQRKTVFYRYYNTSFMAAPFIEYTPFNPLYAGRYVTDCAEVHPLPYPNHSYRRRTVFYGNTNWRMSLKAENLGSILQDAHGMKFVVRMWVRTLDRYCPVQMHPMEVVDVDCPIRWNGEFQFPSPKNQAAVLYATHMGGSLWRL